MKRNFVVSLFGSFVGFGMLLILLGATGSVGARSVDARPDASQVTAVSVSAPLTSTFTYQGQLKNGGNPITDTCDFQFGLWDSLSGGTQLGITQTLSAPVSAGYFTALLNTGNPFGVNAFNGDLRWLAIAVRCPASSGSYTGFNQRQQLTAAPYSLFSAAPWATALSNTIYYNNGSVSIGTASPLAGYKLEVDGATRLATGGNGGDILLAAPNGETGLTIKGTNRADVRFDGTTLKVLAGLGTGAPASTNGIVIDTGGNVGIGITNPAAKLDVRDVNSSGVFADSTNGFGVYGYSTNGFGVYGYSRNDNGVVGASTLGNAGQFDGPVVVNGAMTVTGYLAKQGGGFLIDNPLNPANQYLNHSFVESPDMKDVYDGNVTLDAKGEATVILPDYFEALNRDFRYQLTALGAPGPNLYIAAEVKDNRFKIAGGTAGGKVSWQVTGIRHDPWADQNRRPATTDKTGQDRGKYLYPQGYGQPDSLSMDYEKRQALERVAP